MKPLRWPTDAEQHAYMRGRQEQNRAKAKINRNEQWMARLLAATGLAWTPQATWGYRLYDFWCHGIGIAIEVDGDEHDPDYDDYRDEYNFRRSGVVVLRVRNGNEEDAAAVLALIPKLGTWEERRARFSLNEKQAVIRRRLAAIPDGVSMLKDYLAAL
jgi:very-short-patch-repair endonuclease